MLRLERRRGDAQSETGPVARAPRIGSRARRAANGNPRPTFAGILQPRLRVQVEESAGVMTPYTSGEDVWTRRFPHRAAEPSGHAVEFTSRGVGQSPPSVPGELVDFLTFVTRVQHERSQSEQARRHSVSGGASS